MPMIVKLCPELEKMYCVDNGRPAEEPIRGEKNRQGEL